MALGHFRVPETPNFKIRPCAQNENEFYLHENEKSFDSKFLYQQRLGT